MSEGQMPSKCCGNYMHLIGSFLWIKQQQQQNQTKSLEIQVLSKGKKKKVLHKYRI